MRVKFCGLTRIADIDAANETRPDYIGFVFAASSRRFVTDAQAAALAAQLAPGIGKVGVFVRDDPSHIAALVQNGVIDMVQLHGGEDAAYIAALRAQIDVPIVCAVRVQTAADSCSAASLPADFLLLDHGAGGTGQRFDWSHIGRPQKPFFLAGGINESNLAQAMQTGAFALDLSSGIETDGKKDADKMRRVIEIIRRENQ